MEKKVELFLKDKVNESKIDAPVRTLELYEDIGNEYIKNLFAILQQEFNRLIRFMFGKTNHHFNAAESRKLIYYINLYEDLQYMLKDTEWCFSIEENYGRFLEQCKAFLIPSGGSTIPMDLKRITILDYEPIFELKRTVKIMANQIEKRYPIKLIGEGSYAQVFKYKDEFYDKNFIIKRAKKDLTPKELERFKKEYTIMKELKSPYILEVYKYDEENHEYYADYADTTLYEYINENNSTLSIETRRNIAYQIFKAFSYIHKKGYLHRDISATNVLLMFYDDVIVVKISDFGLVKEKNSNLTSKHSEFRGTLNDGYLAVVGFKNYSMEFETYALTRLIFFVMTGKSNLERINDTKIKEFVLKGTNSNINKRYKSVEEMKEYFNKAFIL